MNEHIPSQKRNSYQFLLTVFFVIGLGALNYTLWRQLANVQHESQQQISAFNIQVITLQQALDNNHNLSTALEKRLNTLDKQQQHLTSHLATLTIQIQQPQKLADKDWILSHINHLVTIAQHRLLLLQDLEGALTVLKTAQETLQRLDHPELAEIKAQLSKDIDKLNQVKRPDVVHLATQLARYAAQAGDLPLFQEYHQSPTSQSLVKAHTSETAQGLVAMIGEQFKQLVKIRYSTEADSGLLTDQQRHFVEENLRSALETTRFALLRRDTVVLKASLQVTHHWLQRYYDQNDNAVKSLENELKKLQETVLDPPLPDLSDSLKYLQSLSTVGKPSAEMTSP